MDDPSRQDMLDLFKDSTLFEEIDIEEGIYWFAHDWHSGQSSNLYSALSTSPFNPGPIANGPSDIAQDVYDALYFHFME